MSKVRSLLIGIITSIPMMQVQAVGLQFDLTIYERDLLGIGIERIHLIDPDVNKVGEKQRYTIQHVVTTGEEMANAEYHLLNIRNLESIAPKMDANNIMQKGKQAALTQAQLDSIVSQLKEIKMDVPRWLTDKSKNKYIQTVLVKHEINAVPVKDAKKLVDWAIKETQLTERDHPSVTNGMSKSR